MIDDYFAERDRLNKPYTVASLAVYLDTSRKTLWEYENLENPELSNAIKRAKEKITSWFEEQVATSKTPSGLIFLMKNYGYSDTQTIQQETTVKHEISPDQLTSKLAELLGKIDKDELLKLQESAVIPADYTVT